MNSETYETVWNPLTKLRDGERYLCQDTLDKCSECGEWGFYHRKDITNWAIECLSCGNGTRDYQGAWEAMVYWNREQRGW